MFCLVDTKLLCFFMKKIIILGILFAVLTSCENDNLITVNTDVHGLVQKGPFLNGTSLEIFVLDENFAQSGDVYSTQISDNSGAFSLENISLTSPYVIIKATGYFFNEQSNENSNAPLTLYAISDFGSNSMANINVLTHLEKSRMEYLITEGNMDFNEARQQSKEEILAIFSMDIESMPDFDMLDISQNRDENAILLAVSLIIQGFRTESELSNLLANINTDIREDGILNSEALGSQLINESRLLNLVEIRQHIESRYSDMGLNANIPDFETYIQAFIDNTDYQITNEISYPEHSNYGENILYGDNTVFANSFSLAANLPRGTSLTILVKGPSNWAYCISPCSPINWDIHYNETTHEESFNAIESDTNCDLLIIEEAQGTYIIEYYENNSETPTKVKTVIL